MTQQSGVEPESLQPRLERAFDFAASQVRATIERDPDFFPIYTTNGRWKHAGESWTDWCAGFHTGMMWIDRRAHQAIPGGDSRPNITRGSSSTGSTTATSTTSGSSS